MSLNLAPWLANSRWQTVPIRHLAKQGTGHTPSRKVPEYWEDCTVPWITLSDVWQLRDGTRNKIIETKEKISHLGLQNSAAVVHPKGTVILSRTASVGFSGIMGAEMATSQDFATWTCGTRLLPEFLLHSLRAMAPDLQRIAAGSTHKTIYMPDIEKLEVPTPPLEEQRRIAGFLDAETSHIDKLLNVRKKQLRLLEERDISRIYASLRGTNIPGPRKNSGFDWLKDVPADWPVAPVSSQFQIQLGKMLNQERTTGPNLKPYLRVLNVQWDRIDIDQLVEMSFPESERRRYEVLPGDLLICEGGSYPGRAAIWDGRIPEIYYQKALHRARSRGRSTVRWLYYCLRLALSMGVFHAEGNSATITHLTGEQLSSRRFPFPDTEVQNQITEFLDSQVGSEKSLRDAWDKQLSLLAERRQAMITAAVTGQFDVTTARGFSGGGRSTRGLV